MVIPYRSETDPRVLTRRPVAHTQTCALLLFAFDGYFYSSVTNPRVLTRRPVAHTRVSVLISSLFDRYL